MLFFYHVKKGNNSVNNQYNRTYIGWKSIKFQVNPMKDVGGVAETEGRTDRIMHTRTD